MDETVRERTMTTQQSPDSAAAPRWTPTSGRPLGSRRTGVAVLSFGLILVLAACGRETGEQTTAPAAAPIPVETEVAEIAQVPDLTVATASIEPWRRVSPGTKVLGRVDEVRVKEGNRVRQGELLARLESRDLEAAVAQARAAVNMAEATLENARIHQQRMAALNERGSATAKNLEDATAALRVAEATKDQAEANFAAARVQLEYAEIRSPIAGTVIAKRIEGGDMATPGSPLFTIEDLSRVEVDVRMPEAEVGGVSEGSPATVEIDVLDRRVDTVVERIVPAGDPVSRTYSVTLVLDNSEGTIKSGMFARVHFARGDRQALLVPRSAIVERGQLRGLFVVGPDDHREAHDGGVAGVARSRLRWVKVRDAADPEHVEILSGLEPGERFVTAPPIGLSDGSPVVVAGDVEGTSS